ncbi:MAG: STAS domain-containing protein [Mycobacterium sp.]
MATVFRYGNPAVEFVGAQVRSQCRQLATVVAITGEVTAKNVDQLIRHVTRSVISEKPYILDLSAVTGFAPIATSLLTAVDEACRRTGDDWMLIPSPSVALTLRPTAMAAYPTAASVPDALHSFSDAMTERRRLLPLLAKTA